MCKYLVASNQSTLHASNRLHYRLWLKYTAQCLKHEDFFEYRLASIMRGHAYKLYKKCCTFSIRSNYFGNVWNYLLCAVDYARLYIFSIQTVLQ